MDGDYSPRPLAKWYWAGAFASFLFMLLACWGQVMSVIVDPRTLPLDQRVVFDARPVWMIAAYAIAVWSGLLGAVMLLFKRKFAQPLLLVSLAACVVTFLPYAIVPRVRDNITTNDMAVAIAVIAITWTIFWFGRHSNQRGWLR